VSLPAGATVWSAEVAGQPIRPGVAEEGAVLLPLDRNKIPLANDPRSRLVERQRLRTGVGRNRLRKVRVEDRRDDGER
jgi:hypothetical protein